MNSFLLQHYLPAPRTLRLDWTGQTMEGHSLSFVDVAGRTALPSFVSLAHGLERRRTKHSSLSPALSIPPLLTHSLSISRPNLLYFPLPILIYVLNRSTLAALAVVVVVLNSLKEQRRRRRRRIGSRISFFEQSKSETAQLGSACSVSGLNCKQTNKHL